MNSSTITAVFGTMFFTSPFESGLNHATSSLLCLFPAPIAISLVLTREQRSARTDHQVTGEQHQVFLCASQSVRSNAVFRAVARKIPLCMKQSPSALSTRTTFAVKVDLKGTH